MQVRHHYGQVEHRSCGRLDLLSRVRPSNCLRLIEARVNAETAHVEAKVLRSNTRHGATLLCRVSRLDQMQAQELRMVSKVASVRADCRQVIDVTDHCSRELLQIV